MKPLNHPLHHQYGLTIIEMMVSLVVGLILLAGIAQVFVTNKHSYRFNEGMSTLQDNRSFAMEFIGRLVSQVGYIPDPATILKSSALGTRGEFEQLAYGAITLPIVGTEGVSTASDSITINIIYENNPLLPTPTDCVGTPVAFPGNFTGPSGYGITNTLTVGSTGTGAGKQSWLYCNGTPVVEGVENMQILYGVDTSGDRVVDQYLNATAVTTNNTYNILTVRIALLMATQKEVRGTENLSATTDLIGTSVTPATDKRMRQVYTTTIRLGNRCSLIPSSEGQEDNDRTLCT